MENITAMEKDVLVNGLYHSEFSDEDINDIVKNGYTRHNLIIVWRECVVNSCKIVTTKEISGVVSSLSKKGLVNCDGEKREATVSITTKGIDVLKTLL